MTKLEELKAIHDEIAAQAAPSEAAHAEAILSPFPGATRDVFSIDPPAKVGSYEISPCFDYHIRVLALANHPVYDMVIKGAEALFIPVQGDGHFLAWMFIQSVKGLKSEIETHGVEACKKLADELFEFVQPRVVILICEAVMNQITLSMNARLGYQPTSDDEKGAAKAKRPPS